MDEHLDECAEDYISDDILDTLNAEAEYADEYPDFDEPWVDGILERQEMEDHEQVNEYFGFFGDNHDW